MTPVIRRVLLGGTLSSIGNGLTMPLLIVYLGQVRGLGVAAAGLVVAYTAILQLFLMPLTGIAVDRFGPRPVLVAGLVTQSAGVALLTQVTSVGLAFMVATVISVGAAFSWTPQGALLGRLTTPETRQRVFGIQFMLINLGIGIGGIVAALVVDTAEPSTFVRLYLVDALTYLGFAAVLLTLAGVGVGPAPVAESAGGRDGYRYVLTDGILLRAVGIGLVLMTCGYGSLEVGLPTMVTVIDGLDVSWVAVAYSVNTFAIVALQLAALRLIAGRSRSRLMALVGLLWGASWLMLGITGLLPTAAAITGVCLSTLVFAIGETIWSPVAPALINDLAPEHLRGRYNSVQQMVWGVSGSLGPALAAALLGARLVGWWVAIVVSGCLIASVMSLRLRRHLTEALDGRSLTGDGTMRP